MKVTKENMSLIYGRLLKLNKKYSSLTSQYFYREAVIENNLWKSIGSDFRRIEESFIQTINTHEISIQHERDFSFKKSCFIRIGDNNNWVFLIEIGDDISINESIVKHRCAVFANKAQKNLHLIKFQ